MYVRLNPPPDLMVALEVSRIQPLKSKKVLRKTTTAAHQLVFGVSVTGSDSAEQSAHVAENANVTR